MKQDVEADLDVPLKVPSWLQADLITSQKVLPVPGSGSLGGVRVSLGPSWGLTGEFTGELLQRLGGSDALELVLWARPFFCSVADPPEHSDSPLKNSKAMASEAK